MSDLRDRDAVLPASVAGSTAERLQRSGRETGERDRLADASRIEIVSDRRRWHAPEFRARVVIASYESRRPIREVAAQYGIHPSLVFRWRREARAKAQAKGGTSFIPVMVAPVPEPPPLERRREQGTLSGRAVSLVFPDGVRLEFDTGLSADRLREIVGALRS
ncbi:IS66-like element accessory protein TnpA [Komagataeibacter europaeus]|uniref:IS66-like element accessory protein TnpA n=1 Tax=Komagataeibacter europaeus TaxID=33995 RepID=UPI0006A719F7|nr:transposase [Komagataeibacter europaeus]